MWRIYSYYVLCKDTFEMQKRLFSNEMQCIDGNVDKITNFDNRRFIILWLLLLRKCGYHDQLRNY